MGSTCATGNHEAKFYVVRYRLQHSACNRGVVGSSPTRGVLFSAHNIRLFQEQLINKNLSDFTTLTTYHWYLCCTFITYISGNNYGITLTEVPENLLYIWGRHQMETFSALLAFVRTIHRSPVNSPHKGQWRGTLMFYLICARINAWVNNREAGDLRRHRTHSDVIVMSAQNPKPSMCFASACSCLCLIHWIQVLSREWRCSWSSTDRRCFNYTSEWSTSLLPIIRCDLH